MTICTELTREVEMVAKTKNILSLDEIKNVNDITVEDLHVPEWNGYVQIKSISKRQMREIKRTSRTGDKIDDDRVERAVFIEGLVNPKVDEDAYEVLLDKSAAAIDRITKGILKISRLDNESTVTEEEKTFRS